MSLNDSFDSSVTSGGRRFATTRWSLVAAAGQLSSPDAQEALATLCQTYWYPLYAYARRVTPSVHDAQDLTQAFFAEFVEKEYLKDADPQRGKFRSFLLIAFKHFLSKQRDRANARKRGGGQHLLSLDFQAGEHRYSLEPASQSTPETIYERRWALELLDQALARLRQEFISAGKVKLFDCLKGTLQGDGPKDSYAQTGTELGLSEQAVKVAVYRLRRRYQELIRALVAETVTTPDEIEDELRDLFAAVRAKKA
jgi:RNA polymerase sigma-70 factor (ECF subfamily)